MFRLRPDQDFHGSELLCELLARVGDGGAVGELLSPGVDSASTISQLLPVARSAARVDWFGVNGSRVDVLLRSSESEWRIVFGSDSGRRIDWLELYRRPDPFRGAAGGRAVVVNGPSGAGKSTLLRGLQALTPTRPWVVLDEPEDVGSVRPEYLIWPDQVPTLHSGYMAAIGALVSAGNLVAVAAGRRLQTDFEGCLGDASVLYVGLYCDLEVLIEREGARPERWGGLAEASFDVHQGWRYDLTFDTTGSPDELGIAGEVASRALHNKPST